MRAGSDWVTAAPQTIYHGVISGTGTITVRPPASGRGTLVMTGLSTGLSNPKLNYVAFPKGNSHRIVDLGAEITTFGDGTDADFWLPSGWGNAYIGTHHAYALGFDYNGTVRMNVPINSAGAIDYVNSHPGHQQSRTGRRVAA